ncbi:hypothetical protein ACMD2_03124 [Ananas comosus]|uniref:Uncharacterized protein n=1 Tax=Ananas comosus TaxID=4615 RepID=A0A199VFS5_ANACO|nr:hypothetical protein ACMD2_03124 [Ananas comosus]
MNPMELHSDLIPKGAEKLFAEPPFRDQLSGDGCCQREGTNYQRNVALKVRKTIHVGYGCRGV